MINSHRDIIFWNIFLTEDISGLRELSDDLFERVFNSFSDASPEFECLMNDNEMHLVRTYASVLSLKLQKLPEIEILGICPITLLCAIHTSPCKSQLEVLSLVYSVIIHRII